MRGYAFACVGLALAALTHCCHAAETTLSIPRAADAKGARADAIAAVAAQIKNEPRTFMIGNQTLPLYAGPVATPGSLADQLRLTEIVRVRRFLTDLSTYVATITAQNMATLKTPADVAALYDLMTSRVERPMAADNGDESFGAQRLSFKVMRLRVVGPNEFTTARFQLSDTQLAQICGRGVSWATARAKKNLFVEDFGDLALWNEPETVAIRYIPNVVGFFCYNRESQKLLPVEIRFADTELAYSPQDTADEWTMAKMGLNAASVAFHQWHHMADTHAVASPVRVELYRTMADVHPVRVLLTNHMKADYGLEALMKSVLLAAGTPLDQIFGWGAAGSARFLDFDTRSGICISNDLPTDLARRGLNSIPNHKYAAYGMKLYDAITAFVDSYVRVYYPSDRAVAEDFELQNWAVACDKVPHLKNFPTKLRKRTELIKLLTHLVYLGGVKHHAYNGAATWHMMAMPYSPTALWKKLPTQKLAPGESLDIMAYTVPLTKMVASMGFPALFYRPPPASESLQEAYNHEPFTNETCLEPAISAFQKTMKDIDTLIATKEASEKFPYLCLRPSQLPADTWA